MASVNRPNLLFYSRTNNCIELLRMMKQYQLDKEFKIINVDNNKNEVIKKIKVVPTMIIPSINKVIIYSKYSKYLLLFTAAPPICAFVAAMQLQSRSLRS